MGNHEGQDQELLQIFIEEATDLINIISLSLIKWKENLTEFDYIPEIKRDLHTLKGSARMVGQSDIGRLAHELETVFDFCLKEKKIIDVETYEFISLAYDQLSLMIEGLKNKKTFPYPEELINKLKQAVSLPESVEAAKPVAQTTPEMKQEKQDVSETQVEMIRVRSDILEKLNNLSIDTSQSRLGLEQHLKMVGLYLEEMREGARRLQEQVQALDKEVHGFLSEEPKKRAITLPDEYDILERDRYTTVGQMSSGIRETALDIDNMIKAMKENKDVMDGLLANQTRSNTELQNRLKDTRLVSFESIVPRLSRIVRQISKELNKKVNFVVTHVEGEMDRTALEHLIPSLEHLLRNALDHGIEESDERIHLGKPQIGQIEIGFYHIGSIVSIEINDDGRGLDFQKIREKAINLGYISSDAEVSEEELSRFILEPGFSTKKEISEISGRGIGMDVVNQAVSEMGGSLVIISLPGQGSKFTLRFPFTTSLNRILIFKAQEKLYGIILSQIEGVVRVEKEKLNALLLKKKATFQHAHKPYYLHYLGSLLEIDKPSFQIPKKRNFPVILIPSKEYPMALLVDELLYNRELVIQSLGLQFKLFNESSGATLLGDGSVVLVLDPYALGAKARAHMKREMKTIEFSQLRKVQTVAQPVIMVVDDSVTIRTVAKRFLERHQFQVMVAKDGLDALQQLEMQVPDLILLDIDMPRMDGFEFAITIRADERFRHIPIIVITSRPSEKHRKRANEMQLEGFVEKPYQELELLDAIEKLLGRP